MKKITLALLAVFALCGAVQANDVTLRWDASVPAPEGYRIYWAPESQPFVYTTPAWQGTTTTCTLPDFPAGVTFKFVARAYQGTIESPDSNIVVYTIPEPSETIVYPKAPKTLTIQFGE